MSDYTKIMAAVIAGQKADAAAAAEELIASGADAIKVIEEALNVAMDEVGAKMKTGEMFIPEVLMASQAMSSAIEILKPHIKGGEEVKSAGTVVLGSVKGDLHDIGKNLVKLMMEGAGFKVIDMGCDVSPEAFLEAVKEHDAQIVGLSALLTTTMVHMEQTVKLFTEAGLRDKVKIILGGAPVDGRFTKEVGADGYAEDAGSAAALAKELLA
jgi:5-methyltetrahydrofolate--homocysteine methyltransferase